MKDNKNHKPGRRFYRLVTIGLATMLVYTLFQNISRVRQAKDTVQKAKDKLESTQRENQELKTKLELIQGDAFVEKQLRDSLGLVKEGEVLVILPEDEILRKLAPKMAEEEEFPPEPNWQKWLNLFL